MISISPFDPSFVIKYNFNNFNMVCRVTRKMNKRKRIFAQSGQVLERFNYFGQFSHRT